VFRLHFYGYWIVNCYFLLHLSFGPIRGEKNLFKNWVFFFFSFEWFFFGGKMIIFSVTNNSMLSLLSIKFYTNLDLYKAPICFVLSATTV